MTGGIEAGGGRSLPITGELWAVPLSGGDPLLIARYLDRDERGIFNGNDLRRQVSADGRRVVLSAGVGAGSATRFRIVLLDLARGTVSAFGQDDADLLRPALSPDGAKIAYVRKPPIGPDDGLWIMNADGSGQRRLRPGAEGFTTFTFGWTPDSRQIAFDQFQNVPSYVLVDAATGAVSRAVGFLPIFVGAAVDWRAASPSFVAGLADGAFNGEYHILVGDRPDGPLRVVVTESNRFLELGAPRWHPSSDEILYRRLISFNRIEVYVVKASGGQPVQVPLATRPYIADWTPDGNSVVYLEQGSGGYSIHGVSVRAAKRDGSGDRELFAHSNGGLTDVLTVRYP